MLSLAANDIPLVSCHQIMAKPGSSWQKAGHLRKGENTGRVKSPTDPSEAAAPQMKRLSAQLILEEKPRLPFAAT